MPSNHKLVFTDEELRMIASINPVEPCPAPPGSLMKVLTLHARYAAGIYPFHPDDADHSTASSEFTRPHGMTPHSEREDHVFHVFDNEYEGD